MKPLLVLILLSLSPEAREFMEITAKLEPVQCAKMKLRREIALAEAEKRDTAPLRKRFVALNHDRETARLEKRLAQLEPRLAKSPDPEDLPAINRQHVEVFYRCE